MDFTNTALATAAFSLFALAGCAAEPTQDDDGPNTGSPTTGGAPASAMAGSSATTAGSGPTPMGGQASAGSSTGGAAGGGSPDAGCTALDPMTLISDFETGKAEVLPNAGRDGSWFLYNDKTAGTQTPTKVTNTPLAAEAGGACGSAYAFRTTGMGFTLWGAGLGTDFAPKTGMVRTPYDLSAYSGIALRAKAAATTPVRVSIADSNTADEGMVCTKTDDGTDPTRCGDYFGSEIIVGTEFRDFTIKFADMKQRGFGLPIATGFDRTKAYTLRMQVKGSAQAPANFDLWLDDIRLVP